MQGPNSELPLGNYTAFPHSIPHQIKPYYISETKVFLRRYLEIYRHLLSKCFKNAILERQEMVQCNIFFDTKQKHDCWKICEVRNIFGCVEGVMSSELRFVKWVTLFERNCIVKCVIFFANFCWLWDFPLENLKIKRNSDEDHRNAWKNMKMLYSQNIFKNRIPNMRFWIIYILVQISFFGGLL